MRALGAMVGLALGLGGMAVASAADLSSAPIGDFSLYYPAYGERAGMVVIYDNEPGVVVRPYWRAPWRHRHYYPATGRRPAFGRHENLKVRGGRHMRAESYRRYWSTSAAFLPQEPWSEPGEPPLK